MFSPTPFEERHADPLNELIANPERNGENLVLTNNLLGKNALPNVRLRFLMRPLHIRLQRLHEPRFDQKSSLFRFTVCGFEVICAT
jgi:hypothetical protein